MIASTQPCPKCGQEWVGAGPEGYSCRTCGLFDRESISAQLPDEPAPQPVPDHGRSNSQATRLIQLAASRAELFRTPDGEAFAAIEIQGHRETRAIRSPAYRIWLAQNFYKDEGKAAGGNAISDAINALEGKALYEGDTKHVWTRVGEDDDGNIIIDLGTDRWDAIVVTPNGWRRVTVPDVHFRRGRTTAALSLPEPGGSLEDIRRCINVKDDRQYHRVIGWVVGALRPRPPYPPLVLSSEHGSGKSVTVKCLRSLIDPSSLPLRALPKDERDLAIAGKTNHVLAFDNVSHLPAWLSDALCRIATGEGWATRKLYTDSDEEVFTFARPVIMTGIDDFVVAGDLLDRSLFSTLPAIPPSERRQEDAVLDEFMRLRPRLFGALLDALAMALHNRGRVWTDLPRMADFYTFVLNAEPALPWPAGSFSESFRENEATAMDVAIEASTIAEPLIQLLDGLTEDWTGTSSELLSALDNQVSEALRRDRRWPKKAQVLSNHLRRIVPTLRKMGWSVRFERENTTTRRRLISIGHLAEQLDDQPLDDLDASGSPLDERADAAFESGMDTLDTLDSAPPSFEGDGWEEEIE